MAVRVVNAHFLQRLHDFARFDKLCEHQYPKIPTLATQVANQRKIDF